MRKLLALVSTFLIALAPVHAENLTGLIDSTEVVQLNVVKDKKGFTRQIRTKTMEYVYLTDEGNTVILPYRVKGTEDTRIFSKRHPYIHMALPLLPGLIWELVKGAL